MQWNHKQLWQLTHARRTLKEAIQGGGKMRISHRGDGVKFREADAAILDDLTVCGPTGRVSLLDRVSIETELVSKWVSTSNIIDEDRLNHDQADLLRKGLFQVVAFVRVPGKMHGVVNCEGMFCVLAHIAPGGDDRNGVTVYGHPICRGQEFGKLLEKSPVLLYPIECLVPAEKPVACLLPLPGPL